MRVVSVSPCSIDQSEFSKMGGGWPIGGRDRLTSELKRAEWLVAQGCRESVGKNGKEEEVGDDGLG
jgi:hypothetical protein